MSLYFNWSCDFQRFTKSKKLSKFQVRTTTLFISNKILSTSLFNLQGTPAIRTAYLKSHPDFIGLAPSVPEQLLHYSTHCSACQALFSKVFKIFKILSKAVCFCRSVQATWLLYHKFSHLSTANLNFLKTIFGIHL